MLAEFILKFFGQLLSGIVEIFLGIFRGIVTTFNFIEYGNTISYYSNELGGWFWIVGILCVILVFAFLGGIIYLVTRFVLKILKSAKKATNQDVLVKELNSLNKEVMKQADLIYRHIQIIFRGLKHLCYSNFVTHHKHILISYHYLTIHSIVSRNSLKNPEPHQ